MGKRAINNLPVEFIEGRHHDQVSDALSNQHPGVTKVDVSAGHDGWSAFRFPFSSYDCMNWLISGFNLPLLRTENCGTAIFHSRIIVKALRRTKWTLGSGCTIGDPQLGATLMNSYL
jgi:hypothetical protein